MNSCILMARVVQTPELRYTQDNQTPVTQMMVEFESDREGEPPAPLKVVGWGNLASEMQQTYQEGDRLIIEGRLAMRSVDRPEGFKEKKAELVASRIYRVGAEGLTASSPKPTSTSESGSPAVTSPDSAPVLAEVASNTANLDDIPF
jgi:single-strand DNA-binding protein